MKARTSPKRIAALLIVAKELTEDLRRAGGPVNDTWTQSIAVLESWLARDPDAGERELDRAKRSMQRESDKYGVASSPLEKAAGWLAGSIGKLLASAVDGDDRDDVVLTELGYGSVAGDYVARTKRVNTLFAKAKQTKTSASPKLIDPKKK